MEIRWLYPHKQQVLIAENSPFLLPEVHVNDKQMQQNLYFCTNSYPCNVR